jgi:hypothetical protein
MTQADSVHSTPRKTAFKIVAGTEFDPAKPQTKIEEIDRVATEAPTVEESRYLWSLFSKEYWLLPFVTLPTTDFKDMGEFWEQVVMWNDQPTNSPATDYHRGRYYAYLAIQAIEKSGSSNRQLEITIERMLEVAFKRRGPGGKLCRGLGSAELGFLEAVCRNATHPDFLKSEAKRKGWQ